MFTFLAILTIYLAIHLFVYLMLARFFDLTLGGKRILLIVLVFFFVSFILSAILLHFSRFFAFNYYYITSAFWAGLVINLAMFLAVAGLLLIIFNLFSFNPKMILGILAIIFSFSYSFYGVWKARHPIVKEIDVEIKNLPEQWKNKKAVQLSDVHLGTIQGKKFAKDLVLKVNKLEADVIFITGDLFDGMGADLEYFAKTMDNLKSKKGTYFVTGNHEMYLGKERALSALENTSINILKNKSVDIDGLQIIGIDHPDFSEVRRSGFINNLDGFQKGEPTILLYHTPASIFQEDESGSNPQSNIYFSPKVNFTEAKESGVNLQLSGHTHNGQIFPFNYLVRFIYDGFGYGLRKDGDFSIYTTSGTGTWGPPMRTGNNSEIVLINLK